MDVNSEKSLVEIADKLLKVYKRTSYAKVGVIGAVFVLAMLTNLVKADFFKLSNDMHIAKVLLEGDIGSASDTSLGYTVAQHILSGINNKDSLMIVIEADSNGGSPTDAQIIENVIVEYKKLAPIAPSDIKALTRYLGDKKIMFDASSAKGLETENRELRTEQVKASLLAMPRKPIVAVISKVCASACIQSIIHADIVIAQKASLVGNIGVRLENINWSELAEKLGVSNTVITSGIYKDMLSPWKPSADQTKERIIAKDMLVTPVFEQFKESVTSARGDKISIANSALYSGIVWTGEEALRIGLIDKNMDKLQLQKNLESLDGVKYLPYSKPQYGLSSFLNSAYQWVKYQ